MSIFKKFLKPEVKNVPTPRKWTTRAPRVRLLPLHEIFFWRTEPLPETRVEIANISTTGVGLLRETGIEWPKSGDFAHGEIDLRGQRYPVKIKIAHSSAMILGCSFEDNQAAIRDMVHRYFEYEIAALTLYKANPEVLQAVPDGVPHWLHARNNCELYFVTRSDQTVRFNISFFGNYVEGGREMPTRFGQVVEGENTEKPSHKGSSLVRWDSRLAKDLVVPIIRFVENVEHLTFEQRKEIVEMIGRGLKV